MLLAEGATLAIAAWLAAYVIAWWTSRALLRVIEPRPGLLADARPDWTLAAYGMTLALLATLAFSLAPALRSWRVQVLPLLKAGEQSIAGGRSRLTTALVVVQFAFSVLLVTSAGLAYRSMTTLSSGDLGFNPNDLLLVTVRLGGERAAAGSEPAGETGAGFALLERVRERLGATPGVAAVSYARRIPGPTLLSVTPIRRDRQRAVTAFVRPVGPDYLRTLGLSASVGRELTSSDRRGATRVAAINQRLAMELFADEQAIGHSLFVGERDEQVEIVGIVPDALFDGPTHDPHPRFLLVAEQQMPGNPPIDPSFVIRHRGTVDAMTPMLSRAIAEVDAGLPIVSISTMNARLALVTELETMIVRLLVCFAVLSLVIAALGHYAVAMFNMRRRTREFGVRLALGASSRRIHASVVREALVYTLPGLLIGFALSVAVAVSFKSLLVGVTPVDPLTYVGVFLLLALTSVVASYLPARRASRVSVVDALRQE
jgi:predicted permease